MSNLENTLDNEAIEKTWSEWIKAIAERVIEYKWKLSTLTTKANLDDIDRLIIKQAREFAQAIKVKQWAQELYKQQSTELLELLKNLNTEKIAVKNESTQNRAIVAQAVVTNQPLVTALQPAWATTQIINNDISWFSKESVSIDETKAIAEFLWLKDSDVKEINLQSFLQVFWKVTWETIIDWENAGYKADWFFWPSELAQLNTLKASPFANLNKYQTLKNEGISILDYLNTKKILEKSSASEVYKILFDTDNSGSVDAKDNQNIIQSQKIFEYVKTLLDGWVKEQKLLVSISNILWVALITSKEGLFTLLKQQPELKYKFLKNMTALAGSGNGSSVFVTDLLQDGNKATQKSLEKKSEIQKELDKIFDEKRPEFEKRYASAVSDFKNKITPENKTKYDTLLTALETPEMKNNFFENFKFSGLWIMASFVEWAGWVWLATGVSNASVNNFLQENTNNIIKNLSFDIWITNIGWNWVPWIGMYISWVQNLSDTTRLSWAIGIMNLIPFASVWIQTQTNADQLQKDWFINLWDSAKYVSASVNVSALSSWFSLGYSQDKLAGIESQKKLFKEFLSKAIKEDGKINETYIKSLPDYTENKWYYETFQKNVETVLQSQNFATLTPDQQKSMITSMKSSYEMMWNENMLKEANKQGYKFSGISIGIQFIAGFLPLPTFWIGFDKVNVNYNENQVSKMYALLAASMKKGKKITTTTTSNDASVNTNIDSMKIDGNSFEANQKLFRNFAQKHPIEWKKLITGNLDFNSKVNLIIQIMSNDANKNQPFFKTTIQEMKQLNTSKTTTDLQKLNDLVAQFFDIAFKDLRSIEEVIYGISIKDGKYEWKYDFISSRVSAMTRFAKSEWLSPDFATKTKNLYTQIAEANKDNLAQFKKSKAQMETIQIEQKKDPTLFWFVASYKIDETWKSLWKWMVEIPAWQVTVAWWKELPVTDDADKNRIADQFSKSTYGQNTMNQMKQSIETKNDPDFQNISDDDILGLLRTWNITRNGKTITLDREFVYFLYGRCANESMGLRIKSLAFTWFTTTTSVETEVTTFGPIDPNGMLAINANTTRTVDWDTSSMWFWVIGGQKIPEPVVPINGTTVPWVDPPTPPPVVPPPVVPPPVVPPPVVPRGFTAPSQVWVNSWVVAPLVAPVIISTQPITVTTPAWQTWVR